MISYLLVRVLVLTSMLSIMSCMIFLNVNVTPRFQEPFFEGGGGWGEEGGGERLA